jgi:hypothetical protein
VGLTVATVVRTSSVGATVFTLLASSGNAVTDIICNGGTTNGTWVHVFNATAPSVTLGTDAPVDRFFVKAADTGGATGLSHNYSNGIAIAATTTKLGTSSPAAVDQPDCQVGYRAQ